MKPPLIKITQDEIPDYAKALRTSPLVRAAQILKEVINAKTTVMYINTVSRDPWVFEIDLVGTLIDPLTGEYKEVKLGTLCPPEEIVKPNEPAPDAEPVRTPASLH